MICADEKGHEWIGWLKVGNEALPVYARLFADTRKLDIGSIQVDQKLMSRFQVLKEKKWFVEQLTRFANIDHLPAFLQQALDGETTSSQNGDSTTMEGIDCIPQILISELDSIGWEHFVSVNQKLDVIKLKTTDAQDHNHVFEVFIPPQFPQEAPILTADLPEAVYLSETPPDGVERNSFRHVMTTMQNEIMKFSELFVVLRDLDEHTKILEPSCTSFGVLSRRLAVSRTCSIKVTVNPLAPRDLCQVSFLGPHEEVSILRRNFGKNLSKWSSNELVRTNLQILLECHLIAPNTEEDLSYMNECGICYVYQQSTGGIKKSEPRRGVNVQQASSGHTQRVGVDDTDTPDQICLNRKCGRLFHTSCLVSWLQAVPTNKTSFGTLFGNCPYCSESISVRTIH